MAENPAKNMSPEEIAKMQKENCIFCKIISGEIPSFKVYEDDLCVGILDINPASAGHVLLLPKEHYAIMPVLPDELLRHLSLTSQKISNALLTGLQVQGTTIFVANGQYAGQKAPHVMIHIIPRTKSEKLSNFSLSGQSQDDQQTTALAQKLQQNLSKMLAERLQTRSIQPTPTEQPTPSEQTVSSSTEEMTQQKMEEQVKENLRSIIKQEQQLKELLIQSPEQFIELIQSSPTMKATLEKIDLSKVVHELQVELKPEETNNSKQEPSTDTDGTNKTDSTEDDYQENTSDEDADEDEKQSGDDEQESDDTEEEPETKQETEQEQSSDEGDTSNNSSVNLDDIANLFS